MIKWFINLITMRGAEYRKQLTEINEPGHAEVKPGHVKDATYRRLKKELQKQYTGALKAGRPMLLEDGHTLTTGVKYRGFLIKSGGKS